MLFINTRKFPVFPMYTFVPNFGTPPEVGYCRAYRLVEILKNPNNSHDIGGNSLDD